MGKKVTPTEEVKRARIAPGQKKIIKYEKVGVCKIELIDSKQPALGFFLLAKKFDVPLSDDWETSNPIPYELTQDWTKIPVSNITATGIQIPDDTKRICKYTFDFQGSTFETQSNWEHGIIGMVSPQLYVMCVVGKRKGRGVCKKVKDKHDMYYLHARTYENVKWTPPIPWSTVQVTETHVVMSNGKVFMNYKFDFPVESGEVLRMETQSNWVQTLPKQSKSHVYRKDTRQMLVKPLKEQFALFLM